MSRKLEIAVAFWIGYVVAMIVAAILVWRAM